MFVQLLEQDHAEKIEEDENFAQELLADEKELAEHRMLLDLGRNDIGRIAQIGSVEVDRPLHIEKYSHVMHIVSDVLGKVEPGYSAYDVLRACFPAGHYQGPLRFELWNSSVRLNRPPGTIRRRCWIF